MLNKVGKGIFAASNTGAKFRAYSGAALSLMDMASDIVMILTYFEEKRFGFADGVLATILINAIVQLLIVWIQNRKMGKAYLLQEVVTTVGCLKPGKEHRFEVVSVLFIVLTQLVSRSFPFLSN